MEPTNIDSNSYKLVELGEVTPFDCSGAQNKLSFGVQVDSECQSRSEGHGFDI